jgi:tetratricopeptide (TPR) repeat protein
VLGASLSRQGQLRAGRTQALMVRILTAKGALQEAHQELGRLEQALEQNPDLRHTADAQRMLCYAALGRHPEAMAMAESMAGALEGHIRRGAVHVYEDYPSDFAEVYRLAGQLESASRWLDRAQVYWEALRTATRIEDLVAYWEHQLVRGKVLFEYSKPEQAREALTGVVAAFEAYHHGFLSEARLYLGRTLAALGQVGPARESLAVAAEPSVGFAPIAEQARHALAALQET